MKINLGKMWIKKSIVSYTISRIFPDENRFINYFLTVALNWSLNSYHIDVSLLLSYRRRL